MQWITNLFPNLGADIGNLLLWIITAPFVFIFLVLDGIVYSLVGYAYKLVELMAQMNFSLLSQWFEPITNRVESLIIVAVMFTIGLAIIQYLIDPDKLMDKKSGSSSLIKNIAIAAVLLIIHRTAFDLVNETTFLMIGAPEGYNYDVLNEWFGVENDGSPGLINNLIFGGTSSSEESTDFGRLLAVNTLSTFLHGRSSYSSTVLDDVYDKAISGSDWNLLPITSAIFQINILPSSNNGNVEYKYPLLSTFIGLYLVYTLVSIAIAIGMRAFKLIILQILAPIAIITIIKDGWDSKIWKNWLSVYGKTFADVFIRVASLYFITAFISTAWGRIGELFGYVTDASTGFTSFLLLILVVVAGFKLAKDLPGFIDSVLGTKLAENNSKGFKNFLQDIPRLGFAGAGMVTNGISALRQKTNGDGKEFTKSQRLVNALRAAGAGAKAGYGARGESIKKRMANISESGNSMNDEVLKQKPTIRENVGNSVRNFTGANKRTQTEINADIKSENKEYEARQRVHEEAIKNHQSVIDTAKEIIENQSKAMSKMQSSSIIDSRTGLNIKYDENFLQNAVDGNINVRTTRETLHQVQSELDVKIKNGASSAEISAAQTAVRNAENAVASAEHSARVNAQADWAATETSMGITGAKATVKSEQAAMKGENTSFANDTKTHQERLKGVYDPTTGKKISDGLEDELKKYGGKPNK